MSFRFEIEVTDGKARAGRFFTPHGVVQTPVFMPVGTLGTEKAVTPHSAAMRSGFPPLYLCGRDSGGTIPATR